MPGYIHLCTGPMFSGKTTRACQKAEQLTAEGLRVAIIKHIKDTRWDSHGFLRTHDGKTLKADLATSAMDEVVAFAINGGYNAVIIDEGQFYHDIAEKADHLANQGVVVVVAALDSNFLNHPSSRHFDNVIKVIPRQPTVTSANSLF